MRTRRNLCTEGKYDLRAVKRRRELSRGKLPEKGLFDEVLFCGVGRFAGSLDFGGKTPRHRMVAQPFSHGDALFKDFDRTLNSAPAEQDSGFAKDLGVALTLFRSVQKIAGRSWQTPRINRVFTPFTIILIF